jgi:dihydrofolate reductase
MTSRFKNSMQRRQGDAVSKLRVNAFSVSADGFGAGPDQSRDRPLGRGGEQLHQWFLPTRTFQQNVLRRHGGATGIDNDFAARSFENLGAWIMGLNMFGPVRGAWPDDEWKGWWGANPPYHVPVFVLTHHPRQPLEMKAAPCSISLPRGSRRRWTTRGRPLEVRMCESAAEQRLSASISRPDYSTRYTLPSRQSCSAKASPCSKASTFLRSATG